MMFFSNPAVAVAGGFGISVVILSRLYLGLHFLSDLVVGGLIGLALLKVLELVVG